MLLIFPSPAVPHYGGIHLKERYQVPRTRFYINITRTAARVRAADSGVIACTRTITPVVHTAVRTTLCLLTLLQDIQNQFSFYSNIQVLHIFPFPAVPHYEGVRRKDLHTFLL